jgi:hypothetical protein
MRTYGQGGRSLCSWRSPGHANRGQFRIDESSLAGKCKYGIDRTDCHGIAGIQPLKSNFIAIDKNAGRVNQTDEKESIRPELNPRMGILYGSIVQAYVGTRPAPDQRGRLVQMYSLLLR